MRGRVISFSPGNAYGFIAWIGSARDVLFHLQESEYAAPAAGDLVEFQRGPVHRGRIRALSVQLIKRAAPLK